MNIWKNSVPSEGRFCLSDNLGGCDLLFELPPQFGRVAEMKVKDDKLFVQTSEGVTIIIPQKLLDTRANHLQY